MTGTRVWQEGAWPSAPSRSPRRKSERLENLALMRLPAGSDGRNGALLGRGPALLRLHNDEADRWLSLPNGCPATHSKFNRGGNQFLGSDNLGHLSLHPLGLAQLCEIAFNSTNAGLSADFTRTDCRTERRRPGFAIHQFRHLKAFRSECPPSVRAYLAPTE